MTTMLPHEPLPLFRRAISDFVGKGKVIYPALLSTTVLYLAPLAGVVVGLQSKSLSLGLLSMTGAFALASLLTVRRSNRPVSKGARLGSHHFRQARRNYLLAAVCGLALTGAAVGFEYAKLTPYREAAMKTVLTAAQEGKTEMDITYVNVGKVLGRSLCPNVSSHLSGESQDGRTHVITITDKTVPFLPRVTKATLQRSRGVDWTILNN